MVVKREDLDHVRSVPAGRIICSRQSGRRQAKCYLCGADAPYLCDHPADPAALEGITEDELAQLDEATRAKLTTCSRPCCPRHACWWKKGLHLCKEHAQKLEVWA